jgi:hypothetical protein
VKIIEKDKNIEEASESKKDKKNQNFEMLSKTT